MKQSVVDHDLNEEYEKREIRKYFGLKKQGVCVEVGSNEPVGVCSQSWHFESQLGWTCLLVEPNPELARKALQLRPKAIVCNVACVGDVSIETMELHIPLSEQGEEVSGHASLEKNADEHNYKCYASINVKTKTLNAILKESNIENIDFLSIDVEGAEFEVLKGINFKVFKPQLILLEDKHLYLVKHRFLRKNGYKLVRRLNRNCWYIPNESASPEVTLIDSLKLKKRLYLSLWLNKIKYSLRHKTLKPFKVL